MDIIVQVDTTDLKLRQMSRQINEMVKRTVEEVVEKVFAESQILVPVHTGALRASGQIVKEMGLDDAEVATFVTYGGGAVDYAVKVHEDLEMPHAAPTQAKYLEVPLLNNVPVLRNLIRERLKVILYS